MLTMEIVYDEFPESSREWDNLGKMVCFHKRYNLGDKHTIRAEDYNSWEEIEEAIFTQVKDDGDEVIVCLPLSLYDHGGITIFIGEPTCRWDSGSVGFIYATRKDILTSFKKKRLTKEVKDLAEKELRSEVKAYDQYLRGEVYGYQVKSENGDILDAVFGFYGYDTAEAEGEEALKHLEEERAKLPENRQLIFEGVVA